MKKTLLILACIAGLTSTAIAQSYWNGSTSVQTTTPGQVGIGTSTPDASLSISRSYNYGIGIPAPQPALKITNFNNSQLLAPGNIFEVWRTYLNTNFPPSPVTQLAVAIDNIGSVQIANRLRIGATAANGAYANYKLSVDGDMIAKRCVIQVDNWADYVFSDHYQLPSLHEVASFVAENKHLPGVPSEAEIKEKGVDMGEMNKILMQKVEELTLYIIGQDKKIRALEEKMAGQ